MKISKCTNAPAWLVNANTKNADVDVMEDGYVFWKGGSFRGGYFRGGSFCGGVMAPHCLWRFGTTPDGRIQIGCKTKTVGSWEEWFGSKAQYLTPRNTVKFQQIRACFYAAKAYLEEFPMEAFQKSIAIESEKKHKTK